MFLIASLLGAASCADEVDEQSHEALASDPDITGISQCPAGSMCMWEEPYYYGPMWATKQTGCANVPAWFNNKCSSWYNRSYRTYHMYSGPNCTGDEVVAEDGEMEDAVMDAMDDEVSSVCSGPSCP
jgi:hypothetical protein